VQQLAGALSSGEHHTPPLPDAELGSTLLNARASGTVAVRVSCPVGESSCSGTVTLRTLTAVRVAAGPSSSGGSRLATVALASGSFTVAGGRVATVRLRLSPRAQALLAHQHALAARASIAAHDPAGATHTARTIVTIRAAGAASRKA
jgi:hypothetical protein